MNLYNDFLRPFSQIAKCMVLNENEDKVYHDFDIINLDQKKVTEFKEEVELCMESEDFQKEKCLNLCKSRTFANYEFPTNLFSALRVSFRIIYEAFNEKDADKYFYQKFKNKKLLDIIDDKQIEFFTKNEKLNKI